MSELTLTAGGIATLACMLEVTAPKPGNVHRGADFQDVTFSDFATSAIVLGQVIDSSMKQGVGQTILTAVEQTKSMVGVNTNLGIILLLVPLAKIVQANPKIDITPAIVSEFLSTALDARDATSVFQAIRIAKPGGLGEAKEMDVNSNEQVTDLLQAMRLAADRDDVARQYTNGYQDIIETGIPLLLRGIDLFKNLNQAIVFTHVSLMASSADTLIARKCGAEIADRSRVMACKAIDAIPGSGNELLNEEKQELYWSRVGDLDFWLRSDGHQRNPGTTADLIAAKLFVAIQNQEIQRPFR